MSFSLILSLVLLFIAEAANKQQKKRILMSTIVHTKDRKHCILYIYNIKQINNKIKMDGWWWHSRWDMVWFCLVRSQLKWLKNQKRKLWSQRSRKQNDEKKREYYSPNSRIREIDLSLSFNNGEIVLVYLILEMMICNWTRTVNTIKCC